MKTISRLLIVVFVCAIAFVAGFGWRDMSQGRAPSLNELPAAVFGTKPAPEELPPTRVFSDTLANIEKEYYGKVDKRQETYAGVAGMISALKDPHTMLLEPEMAKQFEERNHGEFVGIGAELAPDSPTGSILTLGAKVKKVFRGSPALAVGLKANDLITKVNGHVIAGKYLQDVVHVIRGEAGTYVNLDVYREESVRNVLRFRTLRRQVQIQDVYGELLPTNPVIGRLEVRSYSETIISQFDQELQALEGQGIKGLIIDLRGNPGGLLGAAVEMASRFIDGKLITTMRKREGSPDVFISRRGFTDGRHYPVVILMDENSASAAEIFAGAMHDYQVATLVGEHSYGKGSVQVVRPLPDGAQVKLTIARYYLPHGETIQRKEDEEGKFLSGGLQPDIEVKKNTNDVPGDLKTDAQLRKARDVLLNKLK